MSGGPPLHRASSLPIPSPSPRPISPQMHPAFLLPESLRGMAKTPQYQNAVLQFELSHAAAAATVAAAAMKQQQPPVTPSTKPQFRVKDEPLSPSPQREKLWSATRISREETSPRTPSPCTYSNGPAFNGLGGFFIIYGFTPARIDPNTGLVVNSLTAPLPPGSQLAYVPPGSPHPLLSPMMSPMNPMMVPTGLHQIVQAAAQVQQRQLHEQQVQQMRQMQRQQMEQMVIQKQSPPTATAIITPTLSGNPIILPSGGIKGRGSKQFNSPGETGMMDKETTIATKEKEQKNIIPMDGDEGRNNGYDNDMEGDVLSECSSFTAHTSDSESELSSIFDTTVDVENVNTDQGKEGEKRKTKEEEIFAPPPPSKSFSFISGHPLATSSPIKWNGVIKKEPNLDSTIGEDDGMRRMRNSMTASMGDEGSINEEKKRGGRELGLFMKQEESFVSLESSPSPEESVLMDCVTAVCMSSPRSSRDLPELFMTTPVATKEISDEPPNRRGSRRKAVSRLTRPSVVPSEASDKQQSEKCVLRDVAKIDYSERKKKVTQPSRGSARLAAARTKSKSVEAEEREDATVESRISTRVKRSAEREVTMDDGEIGTTSGKKMKQEILKFYVQHVIWDCVADEEKFDSRNPMVEMELDKFDENIRKKMEDQNDQTTTIV